MDTTANDNMKTDVKNPIWASERSNTDWSWSATMGMSDRAMPVSASSNMSPPAIISVPSRLSTGWLFA